MTANELRNEIDHILFAYAVKYSRARNVARESEAMEWAGNKLFKLINELIAEERLIITNHLLGKA